MAGNRDIHGSVVLDVKVDGEQTAKQRLESAFASLEANVNVNADFNKAQVQAALTAASKGLFVKVNVVFDDGDAKRSFRDMEKRLDALTLAREKAALDGAKAEKRANESIRVDGAKTGNARKRVNDQIRLSTEKTANAWVSTEKRANETIRVDYTRTANHKVRLDNTNRAFHERIETGLTAFEIRELGKRETARVTSATRSNDKVRAQQSKGEQDRATARERGLVRLDVLEDQHVKRLVQFEAAAAQRREVINAQLQARIAAQDNLFAQRQEIARQRVQDRLNAKPLIQRILINSNQVNQSLAEFDRTVSRVLRTSLTAFTVWSAGVTAAVAGAVAASAVAFGRLEIAGTRAGAVVASQIRTDEILNAGKAISNFATVTADAREKIERNAQAIALSTTGFAPVEVVEGTRALLQAGQDLPSALTNIGAAARFAQVNELELADASDRLAAGLAAAGKEADYSNKLLDQISFTAQSALGNAGDYLEAFANRGASSFRTYGEGIQETLTLLALLGQTGVTGRTAGTQASIVIRDIAKAAAKVPEAFKAYGVAVKSAETPNVTFNETLLTLASAIEEAQKGNRIAKLRKELGFMDKSFGSILQIIPQVNELGKDGLDNFAAGLQTSTGTVNRQVAEINKTLPAQFDKLGDAINVALGKVGKRFGPALADLFNVFSGTDGLIPRAADNLIAFGDTVAGVIDRVTAYVQSPNFLAGIETFKDAFAVTLVGFSDAFTAFASAFNDGEQASSTFEAIADSVLAFSQVAATVLPAVARILGQIFDFLIDNADAFETFAKFTLGVYALRKAYSLLILPLLTAADGIRKIRAALIAATGAEAANTVVGGIARVADAYGLLGKQAAAAAASIELVQVANSTAFPTLGRGGRGGVAAAGTTGSGATTAAVAGNAALLAPELSRVFSGGAGGANAARAATAFDAITPAAAKSAGPIGRITALFVKLGDVFARLVPGFIKGLPLIGRLATGFAKFAGPVGIVVALIDGAIGIFKGFFEEISKTKDESSEVGRTFAELKPIFDAVFASAKVAFAILFDVLGVVGRIGQSIGRLLGGIFNDILINFGDVIRGIKALFTGDFSTFLKAFGDVIINSITAPFRLAIGFVLDLVADLLGNLESVPLIGDKVEGVADGIRGAASATRDLRVNMSAAEIEADKVATSTGEITLATQQAALSAKDLAYQNQTAARVASLSAQVFERAAARSVVQIDRTKAATVGADGAAKNLLGTVGGITPTFQGMADAGVVGLSRIESAASATTAELLAMQAALQAGLGQAANAQNSIISSAQQFALSEAQAGRGALSVEQVQAGIAAEAERRRQDALVAAARKSRRDQKIIEDALGTGSTPAPVIPETGAAAAPAQREFIDPDDAVQTAIDRLKPARKIAETNALISKVVSDAGKSYQLTRRDTILLAETMPRIDKAIEVQKKKVEELTSALDTLRNVQIKGTQAFSDAAFENEQAIKRLQLQRLDTLAVPGTTEESAAVKAIDDQIKALQTTAERASLVESLELDPLRRKLEETFNPVKEDTFANIIKRFNELSTAQETQTAKLTSQEAIQAKLNERLTGAQERYTKIDEAAQKSVEAFNKAQSAASGTATSLTSVGTSAAAGARNVDKYSTAVENVPSGKGVVDKSLKGINDRVTELASQFTGAGARVVTLYTRGINQALVDVLQPALATVVERTLIYLRTPIGPAAKAGEAIMGGFLDGMKEGFGSPEKIGSVAWYLNVFIPKWIRENKGPVAYDATILVPAGQAVMEGFGKGLRGGFAQIQSFVKDVGPSLKEFISADAFSGRTATIMADIALGKSPDVNAAFEDIKAAMTVTAGSFPGDADPSLSFLHPTLSLADTIQQAFGIIKALGGGLNTGGPGQISRADGSTANNSRHEDGVAADIGTGTSQPTAASLKLFEQAKKLLGSVFRQVIHNGVGLTAGGGSFPDSQHFDHVHLEWLQGLGFSENSGKIGKPPVVDIPGAPPQIDAALNAASKKYGVELALVAAVAKQESGFRPNVTSPAGAGGLMQLMPATARSLGVSNVFDPFQNADGGTKYLKQLLQRFGGRYNLAMGGYNAGPNAPGLDEGVLPPYSETRNYVRLVTSYLEEFRRNFGGFREMGGGVQAGKAYVVGEKRPEIFVPNRPGTILPDAAASLSSAGSTYQDNRTINNTINTQATDPEAVADVFDARTRSSMTGVIFR